MVKNTTIHVLGVSQLAEERERLFAGLEKFVNLGDGCEYYRKLGKQCPTFWPIGIQDGEGHFLDWAPECHKIGLVYRNYLRRLWESKPRDETLPVLLGISHEILQAAVKGTPVIENTAFQDAWRQLKDKYPRASIPVMPSVYPHWELGDFAYAPQNDFQKAIYLLFRESWRARTCNHCSAYFIANKPAQLYCSTRCSGEVKKGHSRDWWKRQGAAKRRKRMKTTST